MVYPGPQDGFCQSAVALSGDLALPQAHNTQLL